MTGTSTSRWDFADPGSMARLRARVLGWFLFTAALSGEAARWLAPELWAVVVPVPWYPIVVPLLIAGVVVLWRGGRLGDRAFLAVVIGADWLAAYGIATFSRDGQALSFESLGLPLAAMAGVFCRARRDAVIGTLAVIAGTAVCTVVRLRPEGTWAPGLVISCSGLLFVSTVVRVLRETAGAAIAQARAGEVTDPLTGLANRRGLERSGTLAWQECARSGGTLAVLVLDLDHFKRINDDLGHAAGDDVLRRLSRILVETMPDGALAVRLGGEEFALVTRLSPDTGAQVAERLRVQVEHGLRPTTVSIGVHEIAPRPGDALPEALWEAIERADEALYRAKFAGRNRTVCVADLPRQGAPGGVVSS